MDWSPIGISPTFILLAFFGVALSMLALVFLVLWVKDYIDKE